jgi:hypothetical protein
VFARGNYDDTRRRQYRTPMRPRRRIEGELIHKTGL